MELERHYLGALDGVKRQGQGVLECLTAVAQGLGGTLQSQIPQHIPPLPSLPVPSDLSFLIPLPFPQIQLSSLPSKWPWSSAIDNPTHLAGSGFGSDMKLAHPLNIGSGFPESLAIQHLGEDVSTHVGQAGATIGAYLSDLAGSVMQQFSGPSEKVDEYSLHSFEASSLMSPLNLHTGSTRVFSEVKHLDIPSRTEKGVSARSICRKEGGGHHDDLLTFQKDQDMEDVADKEVMSILAQNAGPVGSRSSAFVSTTFSSRTQDIETSVVARGDLWRVEATQGGTSAPLFLLQLGPILFVRASTLLLPIHLSKRHCLWYGFDRKEGLHSLCPAVWSKHRRWLAMAMLSLNPVSCSFLDLQFPNGQMSYVAGDGLAGSAFTTTLGGLLQVQGRFPGDTKISYSYKNKWGTRLTPAVLLPERSASFEIVQPLAWEPLGVLFQPTLELSVTPTIGGRQPGTRVEVMHSPLEKFSWGCGCVESPLDSKAFASVSVGRSKRNGEQVGSCGLTMQRIARVTKDYLGVLNEDSLRKNFVLGFELLDEMIAEVRLKVRADFASNITANMVVLRVPMPKTTTRDLWALNGCGRASFVQEEGAVGQTAEFKESSKVMEWCCRKVKYLQIVKKTKSYNPHRWVRYVTIANSYVIRT